MSLLLILLLIMLLLLMLLQQQAGHEAKTFTCSRDRESDMQIHQWKVKNVEGERCEYKCTDKEKLKYSIRGR